MFDLVFTESSGNITKPALNNNKTYLCKQLTVQSDVINRTVQYNSNNNQHNTRSTYHNNYSRPVYDNYGNYHNNHESYPSSGMLNNNYSNYYSRKYR